MLSAENAKPCLIHWYDHTGTNNGWTYEGDVGSWGHYVVESLGWYLGEDDDYYFVAMSRVRDRPILGNVHQIMKDKAEVWFLEYK